MCNGQVVSRKTYFLHRHRCRRGGAARENRDDDDDSPNDLIRRHVPLLPPPPEPPRATAPPEATHDEYRMAMQALVLQLLEKKATHNETQASLSATLLIIRSSLGPHLPEELLALIPRTWYSAVQAVKSDIAPHQVIHACPGECGTLYDCDKAGLVQCPDPCCGQLRYSDKAHTKPAMVCYYLPLIPRLRQRYACSQYAELLRYPHTRTVPANGGISDAQDGARWNQSFAAHFGESPYNIAISISSDSFPIDKKRKRSVTPIIAQILNLPPYLRARSGAFMLLMLIPACASKVDLYLQLLTRELRQLQADIGMPMWNEREKKWVRVRCTVLYDNNDIVAAPKISGTKGAGSIIGACHICDQRGVTIQALGTRIYPGAHRYLPVDSPIRYQHTLHNQPRSGT